MSNWPGRVVPDVTQMPLEVTQTPDLAVSSDSDNTQWRGLRSRGGMKSNSDQMRKGQMLYKVALAV